MTELYYFLCLVIVLLILCPFIVVTATAIMSAYFKLKSNYNVGLAEGYSKAMIDTAKKMKEKENERTV